MTREEILALEAGKELDALVAKSLGYQVFDRYGDLYVATDEAAFEQGMTHGLFMETIGDRDNIRLCWRLEHYSTRIDPALEAVEKITAEGHGYFELHRDFGGWWNAAFSIVLSNDDKRRALGYGNWKYESDGNIAPLAISRAILLLEAE